MRYGIQIDVAVDLKEEGNAGNYYGRISEFNICSLGAGKVDTIFSAVEELLEVCRENMEYAETEEEIKEIKKAIKLTKEK